MIYNCTDKALIENIILHPEVMHWLTDDNSNNYEVIIHPQIYYLVNEAGTGVGVSGGPGHSRVEVI